MAQFWGPGLPDFSWFNMPKRGEIYQITIIYTIWQPWFWLAKGPFKAHYVGECTLKSFCMTLEEKVTSVACNLRLDRHVNRRLHSRDLCRVIDTV
jgi:hypothetical protein